MGMLEANALGAPGNLGLNTQDSPIGLSPQFATETYNAIIDEEGRLACRKGFVQLNADSIPDEYAAMPVEVIFTHYLKDGTEDVVTAGNGGVYYGTATLTEIITYAFGEQIVNVGGGKTGASATGLANDATAYTCTVTIDGVAKNVSIVGSASQTYATMIAQINVDLGAAGTCALDLDGNVRIRSATTGASSTVAIVAGTLFTGVLPTGFVAILTATNGDTANNNWQFASLNGVLYGAQGGLDLHGFDEAAAYNTVAITHPTFTNPNCVISAYGRLWAANVSGNDYTFYWSVLQDGTSFNGVGSGSLDMTTVFVDGKDSIVGMAAHNNRLIVFCRKSVYIFNLGTDLDPANIVLEDTIQGVGCIARDSIVSTGDDILWLSSIGVQSLQRRTQYDTLPMTDYSKLVHQFIINRLVTVEDLTKVRGFYYPVGGWYLLTAPATNTVWVFNMAVRVPEHNTPRITQWLDSAKKFYGFATNPQGQLLLATTAGVWLYSGYGSAVDTYQFRLSTGWLPLASPTTLKHFKKILLTLRGGSGQIGTLSWSKDFKDVWQRVQFVMGAEEAPYEYGECEYNDLNDVGVAYGNPPPVGVVAYPADFVDAGFYTVGNLIEDKYMSIGGSSKFIRFRIEVTIEGELVSLYNITTFDTRGKIR